MKSVFVYIVLVAFAGAGGLFFFKDKFFAKSASTSFFELPDLVVNIRSDDNATHYLKLKMHLEVPQGSILVERLSPLIIDKIQLYLSSLSLQDVRGSANMMIIKDDILKRLNRLDPNLNISNVLYREFVVQ